MNGWHHGYYAHIYTAYVWQWLTPHHMISQPQTSPQWTLPCCPVHKQPFITQHVSSNVCFHVSHTSNRVISLNHPRKPLTNSHSSQIPQGQTAISMTTQPLHVGTGGERWKHREKTIKLPLLKLCDQLGLVVAAKLQKNTPTTTGIIGEDRRTKRAKA